MKRRVRHHIKNRSERGQPIPENLLLIDEKKEKMLHLIFGNRDFYDIIIFLLRIARAKHYERVNPNIRDMYRYIE